MKFNGTHKVLVNADNVNMLGGSVHTVKERAETLIVTSKEIGLEVNADKSKYIFMSRDQNAGQVRNMKIANISFESVEDFKTLVTTLTYQNFIEEGIKNKLKSGDVCYHSVQNILSSSLL